MNPPILPTRGLRPTIGGANIVAGVTLEVPAGELLGIIGPNGAGKTSLFNLFSGLYRPTTGSIHLQGVEITNQPTYRRTREGIGRTFQVSSVFPLLTTHENVRLAAESALGGTLRLWRRAARVKGGPGRGGAGARPRGAQGEGPGAGRRSPPGRQGAAGDRDAARGRQARAAPRGADGGPVGGA